MAKTKSNFRWSVASLIFLITIAAVLAGWYVDHQRLVSQIEPQEKLAVVYRLTKATAADVETELKQIYPNQMINAEPVSNSLIVVADGDAYGQIAVLVNYIEKAKALEAKHSISGKKSEESKSAN